TTRHPLLSTSKQHHPMGERDRHHRPSRQSAIEELGALRKDAPLRAKQILPSCYTNTRLGIHRRWRRRRSRSTSHSSPQRDLASRQKAQVRYLTFQISALTQGRRAYAPSPRPTQPKDSLHAHPSIGAG
ncbi:Hypothetical predicted protein, partial [Pelobates cultripes]